MRDKFDQMIKDFSSFGIELTDHQLEQFNTYYELLVEWNSFMNLTGITEFNDVCKLHFVDSVSAYKYFSSAARLNSGSSSRKRTPLCARDTSPGFAFGPPPMSAVTEAL